MDGWNPGVGIVAGDTIDEVWLYDNLYSYYGSDQDYGIRYNTALGGFHIVKDPEGTPDIILIHADIGGTDYWDFQDSIILNAGGIIADDNALYFGNVPITDGYIIWVNAGSYIGMAVNSHHQIRLYDGLIVFQQNTRVLDDVISTWGSNTIGIDFDTYWASATNRQYFEVGGTDKLYIASTGTFFSEDSWHLDGIISYFGTGSDWLTWHDGTITLTQRSRETPGIGNIVIWDMPIGAGGGVGVSHSYRFQIDGNIEAGLIAETDGSGSYQEPVWQIPYYSGDYGAVWGTPPNPTPVGLTNGCMFVAHNTNVGCCEDKLFVRSNGAWVSETLT